MQVNDVCLPKFRKRGNVRSCVGNVYIEQMIPLETVGAPDNDAFPHELPYLQPAALQTHNADLVRLLVAHQHFGFNTIILE